MRRDVAILTVLLAILAIYIVYDFGYNRAKTVIVESCNRQRSFYGDTQTFKCLPVVPRVTKNDWK